MDNTSSISVQSFEHFKELTVFKTQSNQILFRGQNKDYDLKPGIARQKNRKNLLKSEKLIFDNFKRRVQLFPVFNKSEDNTDWDYLVLAQHYGLKTRLLDWSENCFVALWFATSFEPSNNYGVVWIYNVKQSKIKKYEELSNDPFSLKETIIFKPPVNNHRIKHQESWFSAHYFDEIDYSLPLDKQEQNNKSLTKLTIPMSLYPDIRTQLKNQSGISAESLYNSLDKMCEDINKTFAPL